MTWRHRAARPVTVGEANRVPPASAQKVALGAEFRGAERHRPVNAAGPVPVEDAHGDRTALARFGEFRYLMALPLVERRLPRLRVAAAPGEPPVDVDLVVVVHALERQV